MEENLARQAEQAFEQQGDYDTLCQRGRAAARHLGAGRRLAAHRDIGHVDGDGYLYVVDRKKDLILRGGFNVFPRDIEDVLLSHPAVAQAGVVGRPDARLGEEVAANKYPREITIVPVVPLTSVGKLDRKKLRRWVRGEPPAVSGR